MRRTPASGQLGNAGWTAVDQAVSGATNLAMTALVARATTPTEFGAFALAYASYVLLLGLGQSLIGEPMVILRRTTDSASPKDAVRSPLGGALLLGCTASLVAAAASAIADGALAHVLAALAFAFPALLLQDTYRFAFFSAARPVRAAAIDGVWAGAQLSSFAVLSLYDSGPGLFILAWGSSAALSCAVAYLISGAAPSLKLLPRWWKNARALALSLAAETGMVRVADQIGTYLVAVIAGLPAVGALRAGAAIYGPLQVPITAGRIVGYEQLTRHEPKTSPKQLLSVSALLSACVSVLIFVWVLTVTAGGSRAGPVVFGETWRLASAVVLPLGLAKLAEGAILGPLVGMRAMQANAMAVRIRLLYVVQVLLGYIAGAWLAGGQGAAVGLAVANAATAVLYWWMLIRHSRWIAIRSTRNCSLVNSWSAEHPARR